MLFFALKRCYDDAISLFCVPTGDLDDGLEYVCLLNL